MSSGKTKVPDGRQVRWRQHNRERRQRILDAAVTVLERHESGEEIHVQEIATEAGLSRTVVYRHFQDRSDLDLAVQREICDRLRSALLPSLSFEGTPRDIVRRIVASYVGWALDHPVLMRFVERDLPGTESKPLDDAIEQVEQRIEALMNGVVAVLGADLTDADRAGLAPWVFGLVGGCFQSVRRWTTRELLAPNPDQFVAMLTDTIWYQIHGLAGSRGILIPDQPVEELMAQLGDEAVGADLEQ